MTRRKVLDSATAAALLLASGWDTQPNGRVLCPVRGVTLELSADRSRVLLPLRTGTRAIIEVGRTLRLQRPPSVQLGEVTLVSFERIDLRDPEILERAAALAERRGTSGPPDRTEPVQLLPPGGRSGGRTHSH